MIKYLYIYIIKFNTLPASCMTHMSNKRLSVLNRKPDHRILIVLNSQYCRPGSGYLRIQNFFFSGTGSKANLKKGVDTQGCYFVYHFAFYTLRFSPG